MRVGGGGGGGGPAPPKPPLNPPVKTLCAEHRHGILSLAILTSQYEQQAKNKTKQQLKKLTIKANNKLFLHNNPLQSFGKCK